MRLFSLENQMSCNIASCSDETDRENVSNIWTDGDSKELLQLYYENIG